MNLTKFKNIGKYVSLISFVIILICGIVFLFILNKEMYNSFLSFLDKFVYLWMTLSSFVGISGVVKKFSGYDINDLFINSNDNKCNNKCINELGLIEK